MAKLLLSLHPIFQTLAILLAYYGAFLGLQRVRSLHFKQHGIVFPRQRHALIGGIALFMLLGGMAAGGIIAKIIWQGEIRIHLHYRIAMVILPFLLFGIGTGLYLYFIPAKRRTLPAVHALNNLILLLLLLYQIYSGVMVYLRYVLRLR